MTQPPRRYDGAPISERDRTGLRILLATATFSIFGTPIIGAIVEVLSITGWANGNKYAPFLAIVVPLFVAVSVPVGVARRRHALAALRELNQRP